MSCSYHSDLASWEERIRVARDELLGVIDPLGRADLERARKGGWTVQKVLEHVIHSERLYGQATAYLVGAEVRADDGSSTPGSATEARTMLLDGRKALLKALESLDEDPMEFMWPVSGILIRKQNVRIICGDLVTRVEHHGGKTGMRKG